MKKSCLIGVLCAMLLLSSCSAREIKDDVKEGVEDIKEEVSQMVPKETASSESTSDNKQFIGEDKAKSIALEKAGYSADEVAFDRVELENDDGVWQYEIEFRKDKTEYNADISAKDGKIISWESENE